MIARIFKIIKQNIIGFILGLLVMTAGVYAASVLAASNVGYSDNNDLGVDNVQDAIDKLNTKATTKVAEAELKCPSGNICTETWAKLGDYVKMTPTSTSYTITTAMTGYTSNQTINPSELNLWRVININSDGTLDLISAYVSSTDVYFSGKIGYQNCISSLNQISLQYTNSKYTISSRYVGYNGQTSTITDTSALDLFTTLWISSTSSSTSLNDEAKGAGDMGYEKDYNLVKNILGTLTANRISTATATDYWLASRKYSYATPTYWDVSIRVVDSNGNLYGNVLHRSYNGNVITYSFDNAIRPIITLKSKLLPNGSGTDLDPYILS